MAAVVPSQRSVSCAPTARPCATAWRASATSAIGADGSVRLDPAPSLRFDVTLPPPGIDAATHATMRFDDPRARLLPVGTVELDPTAPLCERELIVREP